MPRFAGVDIPRNKVIGVSLTYIYGIGPTTAKKICAAAGVDTETRQGLGFMTFKLSFNDYYSLDISNKIKAVKHRKAEKGEYMGRLCPLSVIKKTHKIKIT